MAAPDCRICGSPEVAPLGVDSFLFPATSYAPEFHDYDNYVCAGCGVVFGHPPLDENRLAGHYDTAYRQNPGALAIDGKVLDSPIDLETSATSLRRVKNFHDIVVRNRERIPGLVPGRDDLVVDYGAYQGLFLHGVRELWGCRGVAYDYNEKGIAFARHLLGFGGSRVARDIYTDRFDERPRYVTLVHCLEHLGDPVRFLAHLKANVIDPGGFLYVEVPNLFGIPLCEPTHFFTYTRESLAYLMGRCGFAVLEIAESGYPPIADFVGRNHQQNLVCLARPSSTTMVAAPGADLAAIRRRLRRSYARHSLTAVGRQFKVALRECAKVLYYLVFAVLLERLSPALMMAVARLIGVRGRRQRGRR